MPATAVRRIFANWFTKTLQVSDRNGGQFVLPDFFKYETIPLEITIVEPDLEAPGLSRFRRVDISNLSLEVALNDTLDDAAPLAYQSSWTKDETENVFSGELALNTAALNAWLDADSKTAYFQIRHGEGTASPTLYQAQVTVRKSVMQISTTAPTPLDEYYTKAQTRAQFVSKVMGAGEQLTIVSPSGTYQRIIGVDDGGNAIDTILPV
jgi:hypothetical protein